MDKENIVKVKLKPCPFCSGKPKLEHFNTCTDGFYTVRCKSCKASINSVSYERIDFPIYEIAEYINMKRRKNALDQVAELWNKRA